MNTCVLMAEIIQEPQLRYTSDTQTPIAEMVVQFPGLRDDDRPGTLKVVGWGNLAQEIQAQFHEGDRVIIEGRLGMVNVDRPEGFKEKRAELTAQRIHRLGSEGTFSTSNPAASTTAAPAKAAPAAPAKAPAQKSVVSEPAMAKAPAYTPEPADYDDIPF